MEHIRIEQRDADGENIRRRLDLDGELFVYAEEALTVRGYAPDVSLKGRHHYLSTPPREIDVPVKIRTPRGSEQYRELCDMGSHSLLGLETRLVVDDWEQRCIIRAVSANAVTPGITEAVMSFTLLDGWWTHRGEPQLLATPTLEETTTDLDFPHDYAHDYKAPPATPAVQLDTELPADSVWLGIEITGPAVAGASFTVGTNTYTYRGSVGADQRVVIDPIEHTARRFTSGVTGWQDVFAFCERGRGRDRGSYIFQPQPVTFTTQGSYLRPEPLNVIGLTADATVSITPIYRRLWVW